MQGQQQRPVSLEHTHTHSSQGQVCEDCCYRIATQDQQFFGLGEMLFLTQQACCIAIEDAWDSLKRMGRNGGFKTDATCPTATKPAREAVTPKVEGPKIPWTEVVSENLYLAGQALGFVAMILGGIVFGFFAMFSSLFPGSGGGASHDNAADHAARKQRDDERSASDDQRRKEDDDYWANYDKDRTKLNATPSAVRGVDAGESISREDDQRVKELNGALRAVENGTESKDNLIKMRNELFAHREKANKREEERASKYSAACRKKCEGDDYMRDADRAARNGDYREADDKYGKATSAYRECDRLYSDYLST